MQDRVLTTGESSYQGTEENLWRAIWRPNIQWIVKHFLWRVCHYSLPTKLNLFRRKISKNLACPICNHEEESLTHAMWECLEANDVWGEQESLLRKWATNTSSFKDSWAIIMHSQHTVNQAFCAIIFCNLWLRQNAFICQHKFICPKQVINSSMQQKEGFQQASFPDPKPSDILADQPLRERRKWEKLCRLQLKTNWDTAINFNTNCSGFGRLI